ncbi:MAG: ImmA/IrrE family metallo-endopeptidase [Tepidisphaeraceae bacterium]|jgi:Zn-dependent peptidase ImmA (M78 family)
MNSELNPQMLTLARESRGMTQSDLADAADLTQGHVSKFESATLPIPPDQLERIARATSYPLGFFYRPDRIYGIGISYIYHRKRETIPAQDLKRILAQINTRSLEISAMLRGAELESENEFAHLDIADYNGDPSMVAKIVRAQWKMPMGPVASVTATIEDAGGIVFHHHFGNRKFDGQSRWLNGLAPMFFMNSDSPADRDRFTLAHELGHIVMHRVPTNDMEREADRFAAEFLMPEREIIDELRPFSLERAAGLKLKWKVSVAAVVRRAFDLEIISESQYRRFNTQLSAAGYRVFDPIELDPEEPELVSDLIGVYQSEHCYSIKDLCQLTCLLESEFRAIYLPVSLGQLRMAN